MKKVQPQDVTQFVQANHKYLTISDMSYELDISRHTIQMACDKLGIKPVTVSEQKENIIIDYHKTKTIAEIAKILHVDESYVKTMCKKLGVSPLERSIKRGMSTPPGKILGEYKYGMERGTGSEIIDEMIEKMRRVNAKW